jgi:hypothetical protein
VTLRPVFVELGFGDAFFACREHGDFDEGWFCGHVRGACFTVGVSQWLCLVSVNWKGQRLGVFKLTIYMRVTYLETGLLKASRTTIGFLRISGLILSAFEGLYSAAEWR